MKTIEFYWQPYAHAGEVERLTLRVFDSHGALVDFKTFPPAATSSRPSGYDETEHFPLTAELCAVKADGEESEVAEIVVSLHIPPPPPSKLPAPQGFGHRIIEDPIDPLPPVEPTSEFEKRLVLSDDFETLVPLTSPNSYGTVPGSNPFGQSLWLLFQFEYNATPVIASPLSQRDDANPVWQLFARGPTALGVVFYVTGVGYRGFDVVVDDMVGRKTTAVFAHDHATGMTMFEVDGVMRAGDTFPSGIGHSAGSPPPFILNSTAASHQPGNITPRRLRYAVGALPTPAEWDALTAIPNETPRFDQRIDGGEIVVSAYGEGFADKPLHDPKPFIDGRFVEVKQTRNNPPLVKSWSGPIPQDVGREVSR